MSSAKVPQGDVLAGSAQKTNDATRLALSRTLLAHDRTLMAWIRTSTSMISFGFTIYKFFHEFGDDRKQHHPLGYLTFSFLMIVIGLVCLLLATFQHRRETAQLEREHHLKSRYLAPIMAGLISGLGILGIIAVLLKQ